MNFKKGIFYTFMIDRNLKKYVKKQYGYIFTYKNFEFGVPLRKYYNEATEKEHNYYDYSFLTEIETGSAVITHCDGRKDLIKNINILEPYIQKIQEETSDFYKKHTQEFKRLVLKEQNKEFEKYKKEDIIKNCKI